MYMYMYMHIVHCDMCMDQANPLNDGKFPHAGAKLYEKLQVQRRQSVALQKELMRKKCSNEVYRMSVLVCVCVCAYACVCRSAICVRACLHVWQCMYVCMCGLDIFFYCFCQENLLYQALSQRLVG